MNDYERNIVLTRHAYLRMKERNGWSKKASERMAARIYLEGLRPEQVKGYLKGWINKKCSKSSQGNEFVLFGEMLYIFNGRTMLTVLPTPPRGVVLKEERIKYAWQ